MCDACGDKVGTETPNREVLNLWIDALESGKYQQTTQVLRRNDENGEAVGYCCLGVLCELAVEAGVIQPSILNPNATNISMYGEGENTGNLPKEVRKWVGLATPNGRFNETGEEYSSTTLIGLNDTHGYNFQQIAGVLRDKFLPRSV